MNILVTYDVATTDREGQRRLRRVAGICQDFGQRVQYSVFECTVSEQDLVRLRSRLLDEIELTQDSLRIYFLGSSRDRVEHYGQKPTIDFSDALIL